MTRGYDVVVIGAGVIGRSAAFELARAGGLSIALVDELRPGRASAAAAGYLPVASMRSPRGILFDLARASSDSYPEFLRAVAEAGGGDVGLEEVGAVQLAETAEQQEALASRVDRRRSQGLEAVLVDSEGIAEVIPGLARRFRAAALFPRERRLDPVRLCAGLETACRRLGVHVESGRARLVADAHGRVCVEVQEEVWSAAEVVVCGGWWTAELLRPLDVVLPVRPARGEMIEVQVPAPLNRVVDDDVVLIPAGRSDEGYLVRVTGGVAFDDAPAPTGHERRRLLERAARIWPPIEAGHVRSQWAGIRACSDLRHPIVDRVPGWTNLIVATGHHRSGFLLAPITARVVGALVRGEAPPVEPRSIAWRAGASSAK